LRKQIKKIFSLSAGRVCRSPDLSKAKATLGVEKTHKKKTRMKINKPANNSKIKKKSFQTAGQEEGIVSASPVNPLNIFDFSLIAFEF
jgi:hypothetical protein